MTVINAVNWFVTQPVATLTNPLSRAYLLELLNDPTTALAALIIRRPLALSNALDIRLLETVTTGYTGILSRLAINWQNPLERSYLAAVVTQVTPTDPTTIYNNTVGNLNPPLWYQGNDTGPTVIANYGTLLSAGNGAAANMGAFQAAGPNTTIPYAYDFNATTSTVVVPNNAGLASADYTLACLVNPDTIGEGNVGRFLEAQNAGAAIVVQWYFINAGTRIRAEIFNTAGGSSNFQSATGPTLGAWVWLFVTFDTATMLGSLYQSVAGTLTEFAYNPARTPLTGTPRQITQGAVGCRSDAAFVFDGKYSQFMIFGRVLSNAEMQSIITKSGVV